MFMCIKLNSLVDSEIKLFYVTQVLKQAEHQNNVSYLHTRI